MNIKVATPAETAAINEGVPDPFDPANLRISQSFADSVALKKLSTTIPIRKPRPQEFVRMHPSSDYRESFPIIELKDDREEYLVAQNLRDELAGEFVIKMIYTAINRQGTVFFWPVRLPFADGKDSNWWRSAREAAQKATEGWVRVKANMDQGSYDMWGPGKPIPDPTWPEQGFWDLVRIAFRDFLIDRPDHPVIKRLRGTDA
jgi:hypothetical protein